MSNLDNPASPAFELNGDGVLEDSSYGFTKRERTCIDLRIPESGDAELDALIEKARRQEAAFKVAQGLCSDPNMRHVDEEVILAIEMADALIAEMERTDG